MRKSTLTSKRILRSSIFNLSSKKYHEAKSFCEDITEGKFSFPLIYALEHSPDATELLDIVIQHTTDRAKKERALKLIRSSGALVYSFDYLNVIVNKINIQIKDLGGNPGLSAIMKKLQVEVKECEPIEKDLYNKLNPNASEFAENEQYIEKLKDRYQRHQMINFCSGPGLP